MKKQHDKKVRELAWKLSSLDLGLGFATHQFLQREPRDICSYIKDSYDKQIR